MPQELLSACSRGPAANRAGATAGAGRRWDGEKLVLTELVGRFRDACFCCARWNEVVSDHHTQPCYSDTKGVARGPVRMLG